ncbi:AraC family transcriptional regulator [Oryzibacter oryziterrae]|uniref:AraC family transcriptional regulator n=1 Tax=Oryzibacter oryziterrae TaxID=2766474 RepID=UPI001F304997|nr:helix-turn-helix transcriptional regulator [Oryzibacter oryziterrae]
MTKHVADPPFSEPSEATGDLDPARPVLARSIRMQAGHGVLPHSHPRAQLAWGVEGVLRLLSNDNIWIVPPSHAVWVPSGVPHQVIIETDAELRNLYFHPDVAIRPDDYAAGRCSVVMMTPLLHQLVLRMTSLDLSQPHDTRIRNLGAVIVDEIDALAEAPLSLPGGRDPRLIRITRHLNANPDDTSALAELAERAGASTRTVERLFSSETGLSFRAWRTRLRLLRSIERLNRGESSTAIAYSLGYASPSAFVASFRQHFGLPPQRFLAGTRTTTGEPA